MNTKRTIVKPSMAYDTKRTTVKPCMKNNYC